MNVVRPNLTEGTPSPSSFVEALSPSHHTAGARLPGRVFESDPMMRYMVGDGRRMLDRPRRFYEASVRLGLRDGVVETTPDLDGLAIWIRPGRTDLTMSQMLRAGLLTATLSMGVGAVGRLLRTQAVVERLKKQAIDGPHWLLLFIGVDPARQNHGAGAALLRRGLERADEDGVPCYLDSMNERNLPFYRRHGFEVAAEGSVSGGGPAIWAMVRESRSPSAPDANPAREDDDRIA